MAMESKVLSEALVAWSSGHIATIDPSYETTALEARAIALNALAKAVSSSTTGSVSEHETNTAACLVFLTSEVCQGDRVGWWNHLLGAQHIINSARTTDTSGKVILAGPNAFKESPEGRWVLRNFAYHDVIASVTSGNPPLISATYLEGITDVVDSYLGVASEVLTFISEISSIDHTTMVVIDDPSPQEATSAAQDLTEPLSKYLAIKRRLHDWRCDPSTASELAAVAYAYRSAALVYLYRRVCNFLEHCRSRGQSTYTTEYLVDMISSFSAGKNYQASQILSHVSNIPINDIPESALLFPLFIAAGEVDPREEEQVDMIRQRLRMILDKRHFQNVLSALEVLEELWSRKLNTSDKQSCVSQLDWEEVLREQGGLLLLT